MLNHTAEQEIIYNLRGKPNSEGRPMCYKCMRPRTHCVCNLVKQFRAHCNVLIIQHPHERKKYYGTAKIVTSAISNSKLLRGLQFEPAYIEKIMDGQKPYILYPGKDSVDCEDIPLDTGNTIIAIDGTWDEAGKIMHRNPFLKTFPRLTFNRPFRSAYQIRKQPKPNYLSTLESIGHLLKLSAQSMNDFELVKRYDSLFEGFQLMIAQQLEYIENGRSERKICGLES